jgi:hypothetical protein
MAASIAAGCSADAVVIQSSADAGRVQTLRGDSAGPRTAFEGTPPTAVPGAAASDVQAEAGPADADANASDDRAAPPDTGLADGPIPAQCLGNYAAQVIGEQACDPSTPLGPPWPTQATVTVAVLNSASSLSGIGTVTINNSNGLYSIPVLSTSDAGATLLLGEGGPGSFYDVELVYSGGTLDCGSGTLVFERWVTRMSADGGGGYYPCTRTTLQLTRK